MPKLGTDYDSNNYFKDYYQQNKNKECYKYKYTPRKNYQFQITLDGKTHVFEKRSDIINLINKIKKEE